MVYNCLAIEIDPVHEGENLEPYGDSKASSHVGQLNHGASFRGLR